VSGDNWGLVDTYGYVPYTDLTDGSLGEIEFVVCTNNDKNNITTSAASQVTTLAYMVAANQFYRRLIDPQSIGTSALLHGADRALSGHAYCADISIGVINQPPGYVFSGAPLIKAGRWCFEYPGGYCGPMEYINHPFQRIISHDLVPQAIRVFLPPGLTGQVTFRKAPINPGVSATPTLPPTWQWGSGDLTLNWSPTPPGSDYWFLWHKTATMPVENGATGALGTQTNNFSYQIDFSSGPFGDANWFLNLWIQALSANPYFRRLNSPISLAPSGALAGTNTFAVGNILGVQIDITPGTDSDNWYGKPGVSDFGWISFVYGGGVMGPLIPLRSTKQQELSPHLAPVGIFYFLKDGVSVVLNPIIAPPAPQIATTYGTVSPLADSCDDDGGYFP
jgi:hypothetical protein